MIRLQCPMMIALLLMLQIVATSVCGFSLFPASSVSTDRADGDTSVAGADSVRPFREVLPFQHSFRQEVDLDEYMDDENNQNAESDDNDDDTATSSDMGAYSNIEETVESCDPAYEDCEVFCANDDTECFEAEYSGYESDVSPEDYTSDNLSSTERVARTEKQARNRRHKKNSRKLAGSSKKGKRRSKYSRIGSKNKQSRRTKKGPRYRKTESKPWKKENGLAKHRSGTPRRRERRKSTKTRRESGLRRGALKTSAPRPKKEGRRKSTAVRGSQKRETSQTHKTNHREHIGRQDGAKRSGKGGAGKRRRKTGHRRKRDTKRQPVSKGKKDGRRNGPTGKPQTKPRKARKARNTRKSRKSRKRRMHSGGNQAEGRQSRMGHRKKTRTGTSRKGQMSGQGGKRSGQSKESEKGTKAMQKRGTGLQKRPSTGRRKGSKGTRGRSKGATKKDRTRRKNDRKKRRRNRRTGHKQDGTVSSGGRTGRTRGRREDKAKTVGGQSDSSADKPMYCPCVKMQGRTSTCYDLISPPTMKCRPRACTAKYSCVSSSKSATKVMCVRRTASSMIVADPKTAGYCREMKAQESVFYVLSHVI